MHQTTVDEYLEDVILSTIGRAADDQARAEIQIMAQKVNEVAAEAENRYASHYDYQLYSQHLSYFFIKCFSSLFLHGNQIYVVNYIFSSTYYCVLLNVLLIVILHFFIHHITKDIIQDNAKIKSCNTK